MRSCLILRAGAPLEFPGLCDDRFPPLAVRLGAGNEGRASARARARAFIEAARGRPGAPKIFVQVAPARSEIVDADLDALIGAGPEGVFLEACEGRADVQRLAVKLAVREAEAGIAEGATSIVALAAQTPAAVFGLGGYAGASPRLAALAFDAPPIAPATMGAEAPGRTTARALLVFGAAAAGVPALDIAPEGAGAALAAACAAARRDGFSGMMARAPEQIGAIEDAFGAGP